MTKEPRDQEPLSSDSDGEGARRAHMDAFARRIAVLHARGNVNLQVGSFETTEDLDARRDALKKHDF